eukprot:341618-Hanusia_phi.AAC.1
MHAFCDPAHVRPWLRKLADGIDPRLDPLLLPQGASRSSSQPHSEASSAPPVYPSRVDRVLNLSARSFRPREGATHEVLFPVTEELGQICKPLWMQVRN